MQLFTRKKHLASSSSPKGNIVDRGMANSREKQAKEQKSQRRRDRRALRRSMSSSDEIEIEQHDSSSRPMRTNGETRSVDTIDEQQKTRVEKMTYKLLDVYETFDKMRAFVGVLKLMKDTADRGAEVFSPEIELKEENESLKKTLDKITHAVRTQELEDMKERCLKLESEKEELARSQQEAEKERKRLEADRKIIAADRKKLEKEFEEKIKDEKVELQRSAANEMKTTQDNLALSQKSEEKLKQSNAKLNKDKEEVEQKFKNLQFGHDQLLADFRKLKSDLDHEKSKFSIPNHGIAHYRENFQDLQQNLEDLAFKFITGPTNSEQIEAVDNEHLEEKQFFKHVPTRNSSVAQYLWKRGAQATIISQLSSGLWQYFPCDKVNDFGDETDKMKKSLNIMSQKFAEVNPEGEGIWRNLTYKILHDLSTEPAEEEKQRKDIVFSTVKALDPIIDYFQKDAFTLALTDIVNKASDIWLNAKKDSNRIFISNHPPDKAGDAQQWVAASLKGIEDVPRPKDFSIKQANSLCLFPSVNMIVDSGKYETVLPGQVLFADCEAFAMGHHEKQEAAKELAQQTRELQHNFRKNSMSSQAALSPTTLSPISTLSSSS